MLKAPTLKSSGLYLFIQNIRPRGGSGHVVKGVFDCLAVHLVGLDLGNVGQVTVLASEGDVLDDST